MAGWGIGGCTSPQVECANRLGLTTAAFTASESLLPQGAALLPLLDHCLLLQNRQESSRQRAAETDMAGGVQGANLGQESRLLIQAQ